MLQELVYFCKSFPLFLSLLRVLTYQMFQAEGVRPGRRFSLRVDRSEEALTRSTWSRRIEGFGRGGYPL